MTKKHKHKKQNKMQTRNDVSSQVMSKLGKVRAKTGKFVDWSEVDKATMGNQLSFVELLKKVWNIAIGKKDENKNKT